MMLRQASTGPPGLPAFPEPYSKSRLHTNKIFEASPQEVYSESVRYGRGHILVVEERKVAAQTLIE